MWLKGSGPSPTAPALGHSVTPLWLWGVIRAEPVGDVSMQDWQLAGGCRSPHSLYFCCLCHVSSQRQPMLSDQSLWAVSALILKSVPALPLLPVGTVSAAPAPHLWDFVWVLPGSSGSMWAELSHLSSAGRYMYMYICTLYRDTCFL